MTSTETLIYISQQLNIYVGIVLFLLGIIGCLWNILTFRHHTFRFSSCCTYMLVGSVASLFQLFFGLLARIFSAGFYLDWTLTNIAWCKIRTYATLCASLTALTCLVWTAIDRFCSTCRQFRWRYLNSVYIARQVCLLTVIFWSLLAIPALVYTRPNQSGGICASTSRIWSSILLYFFNLLCYGIFPWFFMSLFGILTMRNLRVIRRQRVNPVSAIVITRMARIDHQLTSMYFLQIIFSIISSIPYCVQTFYGKFSQGMITTSYRQAQEDLGQHVVHLAFYFNYMSMFYVNYVSSPIFRRMSKKVLRNLFKKRSEISRQITVINHPRSEKALTRKNLNISTIQIPHGTTGV